MPFDCVPRLFNRGRDFAGFVYPAAILSALLLFVACPLVAVTVETPLVATSFATSPASAAAFEVSSNDVLGKKSGGVTLQGNPYVPPEATSFQIFARQGIDAAHLFGDNNFSPQVNTNFEFTPSIGVSYATVDSKGKTSLTNFGLGLYQGSGASVFSSGLNIQYDQPVFAASITIRLEDFDITTGASFFNNQKVEPSILLLGPGNTIYASASPSDIFPNLTSVATTGKKSPDVWDLNFSDLLNTLHLPNAPISGFILYADTHDGETAGSDPYLLVSVGNGVAVPEPGSVLLLSGAVIFFLKRRRVPERS